MQTICCLPFLLLTAAPSSELQVETDFPGGSAEVVELDQAQRRIVLRPTLHEGRGWRCWWYFKLMGIVPGETITLNVGDAPWATPDRAAFSLDGHSWRQTSPGKRDGKRITYQQAVDSNEAWFAWGPPFVLADATRLVNQSAERSSAAEAFVLCRTREGRPTPGVRIAAKDAENSGFDIWIQARQHAWESGSSWVAKGLLEWVLSDDATAMSLRRQARLNIVPIMDVDNVQRGAGGKNQQPHDHNRDWSEEPVFRSVAAAQQAIRELDAAGRFRLFIDLHNPDAGSRRPYFYVPPDELLLETRRSHLDQFLAASRAEITGPLKIQESTRTSGANYDRMWQAISKNWVARHCGEHAVAVTLETAWNTPHSTTDGYQQVGRQLGKAIARYVSVQDQ